MQADGRPGGENWLEQLSGPGKIVLYYLSFGLRSRVFLLFGRRSINSWSWDSMHESSKRRVPTPRAQVGDRAIAADQVAAAALRIPPAARPRSWGLSLWGLMISAGYEFGWISIYFSLQTFIILAKNLISLNRQYSPLSSKYHNSMAQMGSQKVIFLPVNFR